MLFPRSRAVITVLFLLFIIFIGSQWAFDDEDDFHHHDEHHHHHHDTNKPAPKDRVLLRDVKTLTFTRHKRTTSRRTHSIHQLSCVGGTAGCKLFTPDVVECDNGGFDEEKKRLNWRCHAEMSDRVQFNHVEVICEGYDYPEDDYILIGSCGLEFTLDYSDPHDYHHQSYFKHMDDHEKEMHHERVRATAKPDKFKGFNLSIQGLVDKITDNLTLFSIVAFVFVIILMILVRFNSSRGGVATTTTKKKPIVRGYGPLASAVMTTKKAC